ncbi:hypothetical protein [Paenibacillus thermotolerans]|uniref:hypothetical protein n=1 Tax=Paenibacillus thermotolerans TaxID=3027807 RepID=UPI0023677AB8|nr:MULTISPECIES: hypothetical protein [unclassified Paenibacillus]
MTRKKCGYYIALVLYSGYIVYLLSSAPLRSEFTHGTPSAWIFLFSYLCGIGLISFLFGRRTGRSPAGRAASLSLLIVLLMGTLFSLPLPGIKTYVSASPSEYKGSGVKGNILAPNVLERRAYLLDLFSGRTYAYAKRADRSVQPVSKLAEAQGLDARFADLLELPYDVPRQFYQSAKQDASDPHGLMKLLAKWTIYSGIDATQGQQVMGIGSVSATGEITAAGQMEEYVRSAAQASPDILFVPVDSYQQAKVIAPDLLIVPVTRFEEVLYLLEQPVEFWPLGNFGLLCH